MAAVQRQVEVRERGHNRRAVVLNLRAGAGYHSDYPPSTMQFLTRLALLLSLGVPATAVAQDTAAHAMPANGAPNVRVTARIVLLDRQEASRIGLRYVQVGGGRMRVEGVHRDRSSGVVVQGDPGGIPVQGFIDIARDRRVLRFDTRLQVTTLSGSSATLASGTLSMGRFGASRETGPELEVTPLVHPDGTIRLDVRARIRDAVSSIYGAHADGSPVDAVTSIVVRPGQEATIGTMAVVTQQRDAGLLRWGSASASRDALVVVTADVVRD